MQVNQTIQLITQGNWLDECPHQNRSPSPEPVYDQAGVRTNTRELRTRDRLTHERDDIIIQLIKSCPSYRPPTDWRPPKKSVRLFSPQKENPGYNFIGLIIGPRGSTQKEMEKKTGAKIAIRCCSPLDGKLLWFQKEPLPSTNAVKLKGHMYTTSLSRHIDQGVF